MLGHQEKADVVFLVLHFLQLRIVLLLFLLVFLIVL